MTFALSFHVEILIKINITATFKKWSVDAAATDTGSIEERTLKAIVYYF